MENLTEIRVQGVGARAMLTFMRPQSHNALTGTLISETLAALEEVAQSDARILILTGEGKSFSAGVDLKFARSPVYTREVAARFSSEARKIALLLETMPQITI